MLERHPTIDDSTCQPLRIGAVNYLNSRPLIEDLPRLLPEATLVLDFPSRLADGISQGRLDVALVPSIVCLLDPDYEVVSDACVAARGEVLSVKLYSRVPPASIRRLALDEGSRTSATLVRILLAERHGVFPEIEPLSLDCSTDATDADAVLLIGDRAILPLAEKFCAVWDLSAEWTAWTGLPFVFAMWAARARTTSPELALALAAARDAGVSNLAKIARREAVRLGLSESVALNYLTKNLYYRMGPAERAGLARFYELAVRYDLAPRGIDLVFRHYATA
jgi:chorismate dehydratase